MSLTIYCRFNSLCVNTRCADKHHHNLFERQLLFGIINETPEIADCKEDKVAKPVCKHGLRLIANCDTVLMQMEEEFCERNLTRN